MEAHANGRIAVGNEGEHYRLTLIFNVHQQVYKLALMAVEELKKTTNIFICIFKN